MADFSPPYASAGGVNRSPTTDEQSDGFQCGEADLPLFNRLFGRIEAELKAVQDEGGIPGTESDDTTVLQAIQAMIAAATGGGDTSQFVLFSQAQARLPIFPEITTNNGVIAVTAPATGTIRVPASASIRHRGIRDYVTAETDFPTVASKTYHLRWSPSGGFVLKDLSDVGYNPTTADEKIAAFDSTYDDMLVARIITNSSNVAAITSLVNKNSLFGRYEKTAMQLQGGGTWNGLPELTAVLNWARTPKQISVPIASVDTTNENKCLVSQLASATRYSLTAHAWGYILLAGYSTPYVSGAITVDLEA